MGALGAVFALDMALNSFNASVVEAGGEVSEFSKGLSKALIVLSSLTALQGLGIGKGLKLGGALGLGKVASSAGSLEVAFKTVAAPIGKGLGFLGSSFMGTGLGKSFLNNVEEQQSWSV